MISGTRSEPSDARKIKFKRNGTKLLTAASAYLPLASCFRPSSQEEMISFRTVILPSPSPSLRSFCSHLMSLSLVDSATAELIGHFLAALILVR